ncbi:unnamed protein product [Haemonchus placei]|uniref:Phlebovirus glycoprotein G2 fusion domain-containing protein n=1 Tax=Haemonchus placei TaxID=6290 RepID=A0A158QKM5_HAEPC|nr:unnamed protein product [Haemonchus placei]
MNLGEIPDPVTVISEERSLVISSKCNQLINKCDTRFLDRFSNVDRTAKSCQCVQEKICSIIGMHHYAGCRSYSTLSVAGQRLIRLWSIDSKDRRYRFTNEVGKRFSDKQSWTLVHFQCPRQENPFRHQQLMNGNSRFCCRSITPKKARSLRLRIRAGSADAGLLPMFSLLITYLVLR